jgi:hypothetical protein
MTQSKAEKSVSAQSKTAGPSKPAAKPGTGGKSGAPSAKPARSCGTKGCQ